MMNRCSESKQNFLSLAIIITFFVFYFFSVFLNTIVDDLNIKKNNWQKYLQKYLPVNCNAILIGAWG